MTERISVQPSEQDPDAFVSAMKSLFNSLDAETIRLHTQEVFRDMIGEVQFVIWNHLPIALLT